jgi:NTP pyrophosphatase (non-canonical NTP hydrolase)
LHCHVIQIIKGARKENYGEMEYHLCMALSWAFALANSFHIDIESAMWERFPGRCPYCGENSCKCKERALYRQKVIGLPPLGSKPDSLFGWQKMFRKIYFNEILPSALHLAEETGEVDQAIEIYSTTHLKFDKIVEELVDLVTNIFSIASGLNIDLASSMTGFFAKGCPACDKRRCKCDFVLEVQPSRLYHGPGSIKQRPVRDIDGITEVA